MMRMASLLSDADASSDATFSFSALFSSPYASSPPRLRGGVFGATGISTSSVSTSISKSLSPLGAVKLSSASGLSNSTSSCVLLVGGASSFPVPDPPFGPYEPTSSRSMFERAILDSLNTFTPSLRLCVNNGMTESRTPGTADSRTLPIILNRIARSSRLSFSANASNAGCEGSLTVAKSLMSSRNLPRCSVQNSC